MIDTKPALQAEFTEGLAAFLAGGGEAARLRAYSLGRRALEQHLGLLDLISLLQHAVAEAINCATDAPEAAHIARAAEEFLQECVSPFEMAFQGAGEANSALRRQNELLEQTARRIAHEVHDSSSQLLASVHRELYQAAASAPPELAERLRYVETLLEGVEADLRRFSRDLRPTILDDLGLLPALRELASNVSGRTGLTIVVRGSSIGRLTPPVEVVLYRIVQEALTNVNRHARATRADVTLALSADAIQCTVTDDGVGFAEHGGSKGGLGLVGIRERLAPLGGSLRCENRNNGTSGARLEATIPLETAYAARSSS